MQNTPLTYPLTSYAKDITLGLMNHMELSNAVGHSRLSREKIACLSFVYDSLGGLAIQYLFLYSISLLVVNISSRG